MLWNGVHHSPRQVMLLTQSYPVLDVLSDDRRALPGGEFVMHVGAPRLVVNEVIRALRLAYIVVISAHAGEQRVRTGHLGGVFGQIADHERVVIGAWGL